jgi:hypothetical protein
MVTSRARSKKPVDLKAAERDLETRVSALLARLNLADVDMIDVGRAACLIPYLRSGEAVDPSGERLRDAEQRLHKAVRATDAAVTVNAVRFAASAAFTLHVAKVQLADHPNEFLGALLDTATWLGYAEASHLPNVLGSVQEHVGWVRAALEAEEETERGLAAMAAEAKARQTGSEGARRKNARTNALKQWALDEAKSMRGADADIARKLAQRMPPEHHEHAKTLVNPERIIYLALRGQASAAKRNAG